MNYEIPPEHEPPGRWSSDWPYDIWRLDMGCNDVPPAEKAWHFMTAYSLWGRIA